MATGGAGGDVPDFGSSTGGDANATSRVTSYGPGNVSSSATATGGIGGAGLFEGGNSPTLAAAPGGDAIATGSATSLGSGNVSSAATATGGVGGDNYEFSGGDGGAATATASSTAFGGSAAVATATATGGAGGVAEYGGYDAAPGAEGAAYATSSATTRHGAMAQAQSTAVGSGGEAQSTAQTSFTNSKVQSMAAAPVGSTATTNAIAQAGGSGQAFANPGQTAYASAVGASDKAYATALIGGAGNVADAMLGPRDKLFGSAILGANYAPDDGGESRIYSATSTFDFGYRGDVLLGLIDNQQTGFVDGLGFQSMEFTVDENGAQILDAKFASLPLAESFFDNKVLDLGSFSGAADLTFGYNIVANGTGGFGFDFAVGGAVPEASTWAMMLLGFAGLGFGIARRDGRLTLLVPVEGLEPPTHGLQNRCSTN